MINIHNINLSSNKELSQIKQGQSKLTDLFLGFAKHQEQKRPQKKRNPSEISPFSTKCNNEYNRYLDLAAIKGKYLKKNSYTRQKTLTPTIASNKGYYQNQPLFMNTCRNHQENENEGETSILQDGTNWAYLLFICIQGNQASTKSFKTFKSDISKINNREYIHTKIYRLIGIKRICNIQLIQRFFYEWKYSAEIEDLNEQIQLQHNDLIIERSKLITIIAFSKLNQKIELLQKFRFIRELQNYSEFTNKLNKLSKIFKHQHLRSAFYRLKQISLVKHSSSQKLKALCSRLKHHHQVLTILSFMNWKLSLQNQQQLLSSSKEIQKHQQQKPQSALLKSITKQINEQKILQIHRGKNGNYIQSKETNYYGIRQLQRLVHSQPNFQYQLPQKSTQMVNTKKNNTNKSHFIKSRRNKANKEKENTNTINYEFEESEDKNLNLYFPNHFISTQAAINEESLLRFSPGKNSKRNSLSNKLNISNILKNGVQDTIDEEDHVFLSRLIQKYQRDFNNLQSSNSGLIKHKLQGSNFSQSTLNLNSHDTQNNVNYNTQSQIQNQSNMHKKLHSMLCYEKSNYFTQQAEDQRQEQQQRQLQQHREMLQSLIQQQAHYYPNNNEKHILIDEEDDEEYEQEHDNNKNNQNHNNNQQTAEEENDEEEEDLEYTTNLDKLSLTSPVSINNMNGKMFSGGRIFNDHKDNSISVSKIEVENEIHSQTRLDLQDLQNKVDEGTQVNKKDFSFSIEKDRDQLQFSKTYIKKKKEGNSRNYQVNRSKQERENLAFNELNNVLNQQYQLVNNQLNLRSSDLIAGGTYGGNPSQNYMLYNPQLEQETANFNIGDWQHISRSPLGSTHQNMHNRPLTRSSIIGGVSSQSKNHAMSVCSHERNGGGTGQVTVIDRLQNSSPDNYFLQCQKQFNLMTSPDKMLFQQTFNHQLQHSRKVSQDYRNQEPIDTAAKLNFNYLDQDFQECNSPVQVHSHFANFSQDFLSPERGNNTNNKTNRSLLVNGTTQRKGDNSMMNNKYSHKKQSKSLLLDTSGATTFAQQSAFDQFRQKLNENIQNLNSDTQIIDFNFSRNYQQNYQQNPSTFKLQSMSPIARDLINYKSNDQEAISPISRLFQSNQQSNQKLQPQNNIDHAISTINLSQTQNENLFVPQINQFFRPEDLQQRESCQLDQADPMEIGSHYNSTQNLNFQKLSLQQMVSLKDNMNPREIIKESNHNYDNEDIDEEHDEHDMTLRKSPEPNISRNYQSSNNNDIKDKVPILFFDMNEDKQKFDKVHQSLNKQQEFFLQTQQTLNDNYFTKRTLSQNDLVQLGTMSNQHTLGGYLTQRSYSIQQNELMAMGQNNKFIDAFKQYEAEKVNRRRSQSHQWKFNQHDEQQLRTYDTQQSGSNQYNLNYHQYENLFNQFQTQNLHQKRKGLYSPLKQAQNYVIEENEAAYSNYISQNDNRSIINQQIQEREAEEEESFIDMNHYYTNKSKGKIQKSNKIIFNNTQIRMAKDSVKTQDIGTLSSMINNQNTITDLDQNKSENNNKAKASSMTRKPKEIVIQLDISQFAKNNNINKSPFDKTRDNYISQKDKSDTKKSSKNLPLLPFRQKTRQQSMNIQIKQQKSLGKTGSIKNNKPSADTHQLLINELKKQQINRNDRNFTSVFQNNSTQASNLTTGSGSVTNTGSVHVGQLTKEKPNKKLAQILGNKLTQQSSITRSKNLL